MQESEDPSGYCD